MGEMRTALRATLEQFHAFRDERPKEEKWELIDGMMVMMPPPALVHQRIARNLESLLNIRLALVHPEWQADREIGILLPDDDRYNPEPDVTVINTAIDLGQIYATEFYFVAEVLSPNDKKYILDLKRDYYIGHANCRGVMFVAQDRISARLIVRDGRGGWRDEKLDDPAALIDIPDIGVIGALGALYRFTPLQPVM
jgi:Uma2 family endonuclease